MNTHFQILACALVFVAHPGFGAAAGTESPGVARGMYFSKKSYQPAPLPRFVEMRDRLPSPVFEERPEWVSMYWKSWELAFKNFHEPAPGSGYVLLNHLAIMGEVFQKTGTVWENYAPDASALHRPAKPDFVGWSGIGPILYLLEFAIGLKPDAASNTLVWEVASAKPLGVERFRFNGHVVSLKAEPAGGDRPSLESSVASDGPFKLLVRHGGREETYPVAEGQNAFSFPRLRRT